MQLSFELSLKVNLLYFYYNAMEVPDSRPCFFFFFFFCDSVERAMKYWIVDTDYRTFAFVHSCQNMFLFWREEFTWVISRTRVLSEDSIVNVQGRFIASGLDGTSLLLTNQEDCTQINGRD